MKRVFVTLLPVVLLLTACGTNSTIRPSMPPTEITETSMLIKDLYPGREIYYIGMMNDTFSDIPVDDLEDEAVVLSLDDLTQNEELSVKDYDLAWFHRANEYYAKEDEGKVGLIWHELNGEDIEVSLSELMNSIKEDNVLFWPEVDIGEKSPIGIGIEYKDSYLYEIIQSSDPYTYDDDIDSFYSLKSVGHAYQIKIGESEHDTLSFLVISDRSKGQTLIRAIADIGEYSYRCNYIVDDSSIGS